MNNVSFILRLLKILCKYIDSLCECLTVDMNFSSLLSTLLLLFRLAVVSTLELKADKMLKVQFVGDDDVLNHILDREGGTK